MAFLPLARRGGGGDDPPMKIDILLFDGFDDLDAFGPFEVLAGAGLDTRLVTAEPCELVISAGGARIVPHGELGDPDLLIVPGGGWNDRSGAGSYAEARRGVVTQALEHRHAAGRRIASVCTGAMLLAEAGLLTGRPAITHHSALEDLRGFGARVIDGARVVDDGDIVTAAGVTSGLDLALHLVAEILGHDAALASAAEIEHRWDQDAITRASSSGRSTGTKEYESATSTKVAARN
jgi:transcriptional regulator GlxA family with amidase domain